MLCYGVIGAGGVFSAASAASTAGELCKQIQGAESKILCCVEATKDVAIKAAEEAGWGTNGGGRVIVMSEGRDWSLNIVQANGQLGPNLIDESQRLPWERITDQDVLDNSLVILIYSSGTTGLPKGTLCHGRTPPSQSLISSRGQTLTSQPRRGSRDSRRYVQGLDSDRKPKF